MEKILITGVNGLLGQELAIQLLKKGFFVIGISRGLCRVNLARENFTYYPVDITEDIELNNVMFEERPDVVIHAAAMTQVDECELNQEKCYEVNQKGTLHTLKSAELCSSFIIHVSTDFVFDGEEGMYNEEDECRPVNWYGQCKKETESVIAVAEIPWAIVRTCLLYGKKTEGGRDNLVTWVDRKLAAGEKIKVVDDQVRTPTYAGDLASGIVQILEKRATGIYHLSGKDILTPYQMAITVAKYRGYKVSLIERVTAETFTQTAKRPLRTGFIIDKAVKELAFNPISFIEGIEKVLS